MSPSKRRKMERYYAEMRAKHPEKYERLMLLRKRSRTVEERRKANFEGRVGPRGVWKSAT